MNEQKISKILYGGDYNPEQWPQEIWDQDQLLLTQAGVDVVTLNTFNWAMIQPEEETYNFSGLDRTVRQASAAGMSICMATSTAAHPPWMAHRYPDVLRTEFSGRKRKYGGRHNSCPNSPTYQKYAVALAGKLAERYRDNQNIILWHVNNEYGGSCYCEQCEQAFRVWLQNKYGSLEVLNREWNTNFWGHTFYDWEEIPAPNILSEYADEKRSMHQGIAIDYRRFQSDSMLANFIAERDAIKEVIADAKITTNLMGFYPLLDYQKWAKEMDVVSWDSYPEPDDLPARTAMSHDLMRGIKGGAPFLLMEQTPSVANWSSNTALKRPGVMRLQSYQAIAHGADSVMFFQMRRSPAGCEKFHGALIDHAGTANTRVYRECAGLGAELKALTGEIVGARVKSEAAIIFDWDNWWALDASVGPTVRMDYLKEFYNYYRALYEQNIAVDIIGMQDDLSQYKLVAAPILYMVKKGTKASLEKYVLAGGTVILTYMSGYVNENDYITLGGYPGELRTMAGVWVEESDALPSGKSNTFVYHDQVYPAEVMCDIMHTEGAEVLSVYQEDFYAETPVITRNHYGKGEVCYVGTQSDERFYRRFLKDLADDLDITPVIPGAPEGIEAIRREGERGNYLFLLNHNIEMCEVRVPESGVELLSGQEIRKGQQLNLPPRDIKIIKIAGN